MTEVEARTLEPTDDHGEEDDLSGVFRVYLVAVIVVSVLGLVQAVLSAMPGLPMAKMVIGIGSGCQAVGFRNTPVRQSPITASCRLPPADFLLPTADCATASGRLVHYSSSHGNNAERCTAPLSWS